MDLHSQIPLFFFHPDFHLDVMVIGLLYKSSILTNDYSSSSLDEAFIDEISFSGPPHLANSIFISNHEAIGISRES